MFWIGHQRPKLIIIKSRISKLPSSIRAWNYFSSSVASRNCLRASGPEIIFHRVLRVGIAFEHRGSKLFFIEHRVLELPSSIGARNYFSSSVAAQNCLRALGPEIIFHQASRLGHAFEHRGPKLFFNELRGPKLFFIECRVSELPSSIRAQNYFSSSFVARHRASWPDIELRGPTSSFMARHRAFPWGF